MNFFGIGGLEIFVILFIALMVFGPDKMPEIARGLGQGMRKFKMATTELTRDFTEELNKEVKDAKKEVLAVKEEISVDLKAIGEGKDQNTNSIENDSSGTEGTQKQDGDRSAE